MWSFAVDLRSPQELEKRAPQDREPLADADERPALAEPESLSRRGQADREHLGQVLGEEQFELVRLGARSRVGRVVGDRGRVVSRSTTALVDLHDLLGEEMQEREAVGGRVASEMR